jgi:hypothetical protein
MSLTDRLELLWSCLNSLKSFLDYRFTDSQEPDLARFTPVSALDITYALITCLKLVTLDLPGWDLQVVRQRLSLADTIGKQVHCLGEISQIRSRGRFSSDPSFRSTFKPPTEEDPFARLRRLLVQLKTLFECIPENSASNTVSDSDSGVVSIGSPAESSIFDSALWHDMMNESHWDMYASPSAEQYLY